MQADRNPGTDPIADDGSAGGGGMSAGSGATSGGGMSSLERAMSNDAGQDQGDRITPGTVREAESTEGAGFEVGLSRDEMGPGDAALDPQDAELGSG